MKFPKLFLLLFFFCYYLVVAISEHTWFKVGVVLDMETPLGKIGNSSLHMALSDFYAAHPDYETRLVLHTRDSKMDVIGAASAALDLVQDVEVQAIIGPQMSSQADFIVDLGDKAHIPIISFSATSSSLSSQTPYFVQATPDDHTQVQALASIVEAFSWRKVILIHEDTDYGNRLVPHIIHAFQDINSQVTYRSAIDPSATDDEISEKLEYLKSLHTSVFIVHVSDFLGSRFFQKVNEAGMMSNGYAWIITYGLMNELESMGSSVINSMQGVLGVNPYVPQSKELDNFIKRWRRNVVEENTNMESVDMNIFGLWAYDTIFALAMAVERVGVKNMERHFPNPKIDPNMVVPPIIQVSQTGFKLLEEIRKIKFQGLSGEFHLVNGQIKPSAFQILNVVGKGGREVGFWTEKNGISKDLNNKGIEDMYSTSKTNFKVIIWPGESTIAPKGLVLPKSGKKLKIGVPVKEDFKEFVKVKRDPFTNSIEVSGYCIDVFNSAVESLPYSIPYEFIPADDMSSGTNYTDLINQVYLQKYDAVVGDTTITTSRSTYVDFTQPYTDGGVWMIVPNNSKIIEKILQDRWILCLLCLFFFILGIFVWDPKHRVSHRDSTGKQFLKVLVILSFVVLIWKIQVILTSMLLVQNLHPTITDFKNLIKRGEYVGYRETSIVGEILKMSNFDESKLKALRTAEECDKALSKGSGNGGVAAIFDEIHYVRVFLAKYCHKYTMVGPTHKTDGFGFVFPRGSPLVHEISQAVLNVKTGKKMTEIEQAWFGHQTSCSDIPHIILICSTGVVLIISYLVLFLSSGAPMKLFFASAKVGKSVQPTPKNAGTSKEKKQ